jgi:hypothetical protein
MDDVPYYDYSAGVTLSTVLEMMSTDVKLAHHINKHEEDKATIDRLTLVDTMTLANRSLDGGRSLSRTLKRSPL